MLPDRVSNPGPLTYESGALPIALRGPAQYCYCKRPKYRWSLDKDNVPYLMSFCKLLSRSENKPARQVYDVALTSMQRNHHASTLIRRHLEVVCPLGGIYFSITVALSFYQCRTFPLVIRFL